MIAPMPGWSFVIGRFWCEACDLVGTVVRDEKVEDVRCPRCGGVTVAASGDEVGARQE